MAYFLGRTHLFLLHCGIQEDRLRFRQHLKNEMAHYACDCWDAEIQNSYVKKNISLFLQQLTFKNQKKGWVECVGHADRACYDLSQHSAATQTPLQAFIEFKDGPRDVELLQIIVDKSKIGKTFNKAASAIIDYLNNFDETAITELENSFKTRE